MDGVEQKTPKNFNESSPHNYSHYSPSFLKFWVKNRYKFVIFGAQKCPSPFILVIKSQNNLK